MLCSPMVDTRPGIMLYTQETDRYLPWGSQESEGGSLGIRDIKLQHTITNRYPKSPAGGKVRETAMGRQVKELTTRAVPATLTWGWGCV